MKALSADSVATAARRSLAVLSFLSISAFSFFPELNRIEWIVGMIQHFNKRGIFHHFLIETATNTFFKRPFVFRERW